ncbi:ninein [Protobothrops mucrosquamatus]|uniref:ninein n=1 Tax=Protobothrops mucrosquamatus TaxID=103944 RepID=UPI0010FB5374|nr:ninein [Protobothrops mucrosquamatus]
MDEAEQDQYEAHLKELFDSFDVTGTGSLGEDELTELCHVLHLEEVAPGALQETLLQEGLPRRVHFDQFKDALILILSSTLTNEESFQQPDSSPEAQPKYIKDGKRYGRRSLPEFQQTVEEFAEVTVIEPLNKDALSSRLSNNDCDENWQSQDSEEYEAEGQLRFWNPDDLNTSPNIFPSQDWIEEKLHEVCKNLGISRDGHLNRKKLVSICEQFGLQNIDTQILEEVFRNLDHNNGTMSIEDFFYGLFKIGKPLPPSASTPYRQLKRHLSMQAFDESGRRTTPPSAMTSTISFRVFSSLDDGMGYAAVEQILDAWQEQGIENSQEILNALDFSLDGKINLAELTFALENELLIAKNGIYQAALAAFKMEIRHLIERADLVLREKDKLLLDLEKVEKRASLMATEVDDHHAAIERQNEYNLSKLDEEYKDRVAALKTEFQKDCERIQQQATKQQAELEQEVEKMKTEENYLQDRLALTLKENSRLEHELLETGEKLVKYESMMSKLQNNWENVLVDKFGDLDPGSAEFFLQEERLSQMKKKYEQQCRELQDHIDELQSQLEEYQIQGRIIRPSLQNTLYEELNDCGVQSSQEPASEDCSHLNMSIEAEIIIEQLKDQLHQDVYNLQQELENTVCHYEKQLEETKANYEEGQENVQQEYCQERQVLEEQIECLQVQISELQGQVASLRQASSQQSVEGNSLQICLDEKASLIECLRIDHERELQARLKEAEENFSHEKEELIQSKSWLEERMRTLAQAIQEEKMELENGFFGDLDPGSAEFFLQEERLSQMKKKYEQQCRELQDHIDELQSQLEEYQIQGRIIRPSLQNTLYEELNDYGVQSSQEPASEDCSHLNMSIEAEIIIEQLKDQLHQDVYNLQQELENTVCHYEKQLEEAKANYEEGQENVQQEYCQERQMLEEQIECLQVQISELQGQLASLMQASSQQSVEGNSLQICMDEKASLIECLRIDHERELQARLKEAEENFSHEKEELIQSKSWLEERMRTLAQAIQEEKMELENGFHEKLQRLMEKQALEMDQLQQELLRVHQQELQEQKIKMENEYNGRIFQKEEWFTAEQQTLARKYEETINKLEDQHQQELLKFSRLQLNEKSQWESEKNKILQEGIEVQAKWKEKLEKETAISSLLEQDKKLLETNYKEQLNLLILEKEQLQQEVQDMKKQESELCEKLLKKFECEMGLRKREEMPTLEEEQKQLSKKLGRLETEFAHEQEEQNSKTLEYLKQEMPSRATEEKNELKSKILVLENKIEDLQHELQCQSKLQSNLVSLNKDEEAKGSDFLESVKPRDPGKEINVLSKQEIVQDPGEENSVGTTFLTDDLLKEPEKEPSQCPGFIPLVPETFVGAQFLSVTDKDSSQVVTEDGMKKLDKIAIPNMKNGGTTAEETMETSHVLPKAYEEILAENEALKLRQNQLLERIILLETECNQAAHARQDMASQVQKELEEILKTIPQPNVLACGSDEKGESLHWEKLPTGCATKNQMLFAEALDADLSVEEMSAYSLLFEADHGEARTDKGDLHDIVSGFWDMDMMEDADSRIGSKIFQFPEELKLENQALKTEIIKLLERNNKLEGYMPIFISLQSRLDETNQDCLTLEEEKGQLLQKVKDLEKKQDQLVMENANLQKSKLILQSQLGKLDELMLNLQPQKSGRLSRCENVTKDAEVDRKGLHELNRKLKEKIAVLLKQKGTHTQEKESLNAVLHSLQSTYNEQLQKIEFLREKTETVLKEKMIVQKIAESLKKQVSELKARNQQLELENAELAHRNSPSRADIQDSNQQLMKTFRQKEKETRKYMSEEWERENSQLKEELENSKIQSSSLVSSLETELGQLRIQVHGLEQENHFLKEELENVKQLPSCLDLSELESEISSVIIKNQKLLKEKEALSEELNRYMEKATKVAFLESLTASLREENSSLEHQNQHLKAQMAVSQDKIQNFDDIVQNVSLQVSRLKSDLRVTQQEKENLKQEVMSLTKQLQMANEKSRFLEAAMHSSGIQNQQKKLCWGELELIKQENEQRQREFQGAKSELSHSREKLLHSNSSMMLSPPQHPRELQEIQQQGCPVVPSEQYQQLQHQFLQAERRCQRLQEELENRPLETNMPQGGYEQLLQTMEKRMMDVEQQLRLVKQLLQDKVNQLKEQLVRNTKADEMVKDLYVENAQLLKALELTERRQKMEEKKNYLLEEKIANLGRIVKNLTSNVGSSAQLGS